MPPKRSSFGRRLVPASFAAVLIAAAALASPAPPSPADASPPAGLSVAEFDRLRAGLRLKSQPWAAIPWKASVTDARRAAAEARKPVFLVVNTGNCLGFV
jgi:hypothetical protein